MDTAGEVIVARCGLVCSNCGAYRKGRCDGCYGEKPMYRGCPVRACIIERQCSTCAECTSYADLHDCRKLHNLISRVFGFIFRSDRIGNLDEIRRSGLEAFKTSRRADGRK